jgi:hypothetical protein
MSQCTITTLNICDDDANVTNTAFISKTPLKEMNTNILTTLEHCAQCESDCDCKMINNKMPDNRFLNVGIISQDNELHAAVNGIDDLEDDHGVESEIDDYDDELDAQIEAAKKKIDALEKYRLRLLTENAHLLKEIKNSRQFSREE